MTTGVSKSLNINFNCTYQLTSNINTRIGYIDTESRDMEVYVPFMKTFINGNKYEVAIAASSPYIEFISINPQEDDNYIYKPFSTYLKVGDNGEFGKNLYQYLDEFLTNNGHEGTYAYISEIPQIQEINIDPYATYPGDTIITKNYDGSISIDLGHRLYENGELVEVTSTEPT